ncbi:ROK family protein [soil metagenome]
MTFPLMGAVELGGTKINVAVGTGPGALLASAKIPTTSPEQTLAAVIEFFRKQPALTAIGIGSFGPVCLDPAAPEWGSITQTPKPGWAHTQVATTIRDAMNVPVAFDTDVNAAALGEYRWGALAGCQTGLYLTVGTGIGGGIIIDGRPHHGMIHPEFGHVRVKRSAGDDFAGTCPYHGDCAEGLASGTAIAARLGRSLSEGDPDDPQHRFVYDALGQALATYVLTVSPHRIVVGGGVSEAPGFHEALRVSMGRWLAGYIDAPQIADQNYIVPPKFIGKAGVLGAIAMALDLSAVR